MLKVALALLFVAVLALHTEAVYYGGYGGFFPQIYSYGVAPIGSLGFGKFGYGGFGFGGYGHGIGYGYPLIGGFYGKGYGSYY